MLHSKNQLRVVEEVREGERLVVVATNVAETSLTIPGIKQGSYNLQSPVTFVRPKIPIAPVAQEILRPNLPYLGFPCGRILASHVSAAIQPHFDIEPGRYFQQLQHSRPPRGSLETRPRFPNFSSTSYRTISTARPHICKLFRPISKEPRYSSPNFGDRQRPQPQRASSPKNRATIHSSTILGRTSFEDLRPRISPIPVEIFNSTRTAQLARKTTTAATIIRHSRPLQSSKPSKPQSNEPRTHFRKPRDSETQLPRFTRAQLILAPGQFSCPG
ncbi:unnamed protein product [Prunus armeniaca]|uniref:Helicase C-terminal domain-containing protein n=1 Tax=Prunus armeniaca TaxID=36596 RepID=A0A6J5W282_PRUAR|nr:unnamed protein product [Prunus armeniaca]CAB4293854.1 unnamed protein product [Prunus armeniaca]